MQIRQLQLGLLAFWTIHFGGDAVAAARVLPFDFASRAGAFGAAHLLGLASFAVAALFLLSLLVHLIGVPHEQGDADFYAETGLTGGLVLTAISGAADMQATMATATALAVSAIALGLSTNFARSISPATDDVTVPETDPVTKRARQAAMMAGLTRSTGKGPAR